MWSRIRRAFGRIGIRLLAFNLLLVFLPAAGMLYLGVYERQLLEAQERSMVQQGRILAAALSGAGLGEDEVERILLALDQQVTARIRVVDADGWLLGDSSLLGPQREPEGEAEPWGSVRQSWTYRIGSALFRPLQRLLGEPGPVDATPESYAPDRPLLGREVLAALSGRYGAATRLSPGQRSVTLYSALPIREGREVVGAVIVSQSTLGILQDLLDVRVAIFRVFLVSVGVAALLSLVATTTIARPLRRLQREALALVDRRGRLRGRFSGSRRSDEIGDLARALEELSRRLEQHVGFIESFAADVSHEFRNPLTAIRAATEMLSEVEDPVERRRFLHMVQRDVARLENLLSTVREVTRIDANLEREERARMVLNDWLPQLVEGFRLRDGERVRLALELPPEEVAVRARPERLAQVFENLLDNALGFSPPGAPVELSLRREGQEALVAVRDHGPGIPEEHRERIFHRFFSHRPGELAARTPHTGLGLAIVRAVVEGYGGSVGARNAPGGGALFEVRLPRAEA
jgi:two-component system, OmpR family, sensor histidine kinase ChvG